MMKNIFSGIKFFRSIALGIIFLGSILIYTVSGEDTNNPYKRRVGFSIVGGYAHSESSGGMADLNLELLFSLSSNVRIGLGVGYISGSDDMHMQGNFGSMQGNMMGGMIGGMGSEIMGGFSGHGHSLKVVPFTLSLYYVLPINPKLDIFMLGGTGYYLGSYKDQTSQNESAFGPHVGVGIDFEIADRITVVAEGLYRFANLKGFTSELHEGFRQGTADEEHEEGFWHFHHHEEEWHFHEEHENGQQILMDVPSFNISLNGISLRIGIKFGF
jgi:opacity protein-like surface antigen